MQEVVEETSFERLSGRKSGTADPKSNFRQGASGDWRNYFTKRDSKLFAEAANDMLLAQGYETESEWFRCI